jgi:hypothetical protein
MSVTGFNLQRRKNSQGICQNDIPNFEQMEWPALKKFAAEKGIEVKGKKKEAIILALKELEAISDGDNNTGEGKGDPANNGQ